MRGDSKYRTGSSLKGTTVLLGTDETYMNALSSEEKLMKNFGAAQRVTGGSKACFEALAMKKRKTIEDVELPKIKDPKVIVPAKPAADAAAPGRA